MVVFHKIKNRIPTRSSHLTFGCISKRIQSRILKSNSLQSQNSLGHQLPAQSKSMYISIDFPKYQLFPSIHRGLLPGTSMETKSHEYSSPLCKMAQINTYSQPFVSVDSQSCIKIVRVLFGKKSTYTWTHAVQNHAVKGQLYVHPMEYNEALKKKIQLYDKTSLNLKDMNAQ